jgi:hypothetical protein
VELGLPLLFRDVFQQQGQDVAPEEISNLQVFVELLVILGVELVGGQGDGLVGQFLFDLGSVHLLGREIQGQGDSLDLGF